MRDGIITNKWVLGKGDFADIESLRREAFVIEQGIPEDFEFDALDEHAVHLVVYLDDEPIATGRVAHNGEEVVLARLCVKKEARGVGIGDLAVKLLLIKAFATADAVAVKAQTRYRGFYERYGFQAVGAPFYSNGIEHIKMKADRDAVVFPSKCGENKAGDFIKKDGI